MRAAASPGGSDFTVSLASFGHVMRVWGVLGPAVGESLLGIGSTDEGRVTVLYFCVALLVGHSERVLLAVGWLTLILFFFWFFGFPADQQMM